MPDNEIVNYVDKYGKKRKGKHFECEVCKISFLGRLTDRNRFCSPKCFGFSQREKIELICSLCGKKFERTPSDLERSKNKVYFCSRVCKDEGQKLKHNIKEIHPSHYGTGEIKYRDLFDIKDLKCERCGYDEFSCSVQIHHKDEDRQNNSLNNLMKLCANCHMALHHKKWGLGASGNTSGLQPEFESSILSDSIN